MQFLVIEGTVRSERKSIHAARHVTDLLEERGHDAELFDMTDHDIPMMKTRRYKDPGEPPEGVELFGRMVEHADGIVIVTPEYNHSYPGALKNLIDYLYPEYEDKPFAFVTVSGGPWGGVRTQNDLNELVLTLRGHPGPSLAIKHVGNVFDADGNLMSEDYEEWFEDFIDDAVAHTERFADGAN